VTEPLSNSERRGRRRTAARVPVQLKPKDREAASAETRDLSENGIFVYADSALSEGSELEMVLVLPPEITGGKRGWACCQASVVRLEPADQSGRFGIAAAIHRFDMLPEISG